MLKDFKSNLQLYLILAFLTPLIVYAIKKEQAPKEEKLAPQDRKDKFYFGENPIPGLASMSSYQQATTLVLNYSATHQGHSDIFIYDSSMEEEDVSKGFNIKYNQIKDLDLLNRVPKHFKNENLPYWIHYKAAESQIEFKVKEMHREPINYYGYLQHHFLLDSDKTGTTERVAKGTYQEYYYQYIHPEWTYIEQKIYKPDHPVGDEYLPFDKQQLPYSKTINYLPQIERSMRKAYDAYVEYMQKSGVELTGDVPVEIIKGSVIDTSMNALLDGTKINYSYLSQFDDSKDIFEALPINKPEKITISKDSFNVEIGPYTPLEHVFYKISAFKRQFPASQVGTCTQVGEEIYEYYPHPGWVVRKQRIN